MVYVSVGAHRYDWSQELTVSFLLDQGLATCGSGAACGSLEPPEWFPGAFSKMEKDGRKYIIFLF